MERSEILARAQVLIRAEGDAVSRVADQLSDSFVMAVEWVSQCTERIIISGAGTSGAMAERMAHLMATCGMPGFYISPGNALHGASALIHPGDLFIALSKAGKSADINQFATIARQRGAKVICLTANPASELAQLSDLVVLLPVDPEGEGEGVLPLGSTLAYGAFGDALVLLAKQIRGFDLVQLVQTHPSGATGDLVKQSKTEA